MNSGGLFAYLAKAGCRTWKTNEARTNEDLFIYSSLLLFHAILHTAILEEGAVGKGLLIKQRILGFKWFGERPHLENGLSKDMFFEVNTYTCSSPPTMPCFLSVALVIATILVGIHHWQIKQVLKSGTRFPGLFFAASPTLLEQSTSHHQ